jgi:riboflavin synthase
MFTGIIEAMGSVIRVEKNNSNLTFSIQSPFLNEIKIDQSIAHNGVCLTVDGIFDDYYTVTAIFETLQKTNLGDLQPGSLVNLERCLKLGDRLDGHIVQGHVDGTARVVSVKDQQGSWEYSFEYEPSGFITVSKGSICVNGVSLTVVQSAPGKFSVAIIPYTFEHTNFKSLQPGSRVNLEFDLVGKYILEASRFAPYLT